MPGKKTTKRPATNTSKAAEGTLLARASEEPKDEPKDGAKEGFIALHNAGKYHHEDPSPDTTKAIRVRYAKSTKGALSAPHKLHLAALVDTFGATEKIIKSRYLQGVHETDKPAPQGRKSGKAASSASASEGATIPVVDVLALLMNTDDGAVERLPPALIKPCMEVLAANVKWDEIDEKSVIAVFHTLAGLPSRISFSE